MEQAITSVFVAVLTSVVTWKIHDRTSRHLFMAEKVAKKLLESKQWKKRSFSQIKERIGGFGDDELRQILVRAGAVRFIGQDKVEHWGLLAKNNVE